MKKVLIVAYYYPPAAGVGTFRVTKFVKYLLKFGWSPYVVTVEDSYHKSSDNSILADANKAKKIYKTKISSIPINDVGIKWMGILYKKAKKIIKEDDIDIVYYTGGPFFQWIVAPRLKKTTGVPYVIDYRDPWGFNPYEKNGRGIKKKIGDVVTKYFEPKVIADSSLAFFANQFMQTEYKKYFPEHSKKFKVIENGFDPEDYKKIKPAKFSKYTIMYTGKFLHYRNPENLFRAIANFSKKFPCQFVHVGSREEPIINIAKKYLTDQIQFVGPKKYKEAIGYTKGADVLIIISEGSCLGFPQKVFDYLACNKPIVAIGDKKSYFGRFLSEFENVILVEDDAYKIEEAISRIRRNALGARSTISNTILRDHTRENLTNVLAEELNKIVP